MNNPIDKLLTEWAYRVHDGMPDISDNYHLVQLEQYLNELRLPREAVKRVLEKVRKYKDNAQNQALDRVGKSWGSEGKPSKDNPTQDEPEKDKKEHSLKTDAERDKKLAEVAGLFIDDDAETTRGSGRFKMSKKDVEQYREWLSLTDEQRQAKIDKIKADQEEKLGGPVTEEDVDRTIEELREKLGPKAFNALKQAIRKKGDPPPENTKGEIGEKRFRAIVKHYLETGGVSPISGEVVSFHDSQLDHITSLDNGGKDEGDNWMWMEARFNQFKGKLTDPEVERKLIERGLMSVNEITQETEEEELNNWKNEAEVAYWETQFENGNPANISQEKIDNMSAEELNNFTKAWNNYVGEGDPRYVARYGTRKVEVAGSEKPLPMSRGGDVQPDKNNPDSWGLHKSGDGTMSEPTLKDDPDGYEKALAIYEKSRQSGGKKISTDEVRDNIKGRLATDDTPFGSSIPDASEEERMDEVMESIQGQKISRKQSIDALGAKIKENPKSSSAAKKQIDKELKDSGILAMIKKAKGNGSTKEPEHKEDYDKAVKEKNDFLLVKWREWETGVEAK